MITAEQIAKFTDSRLPTPSMVVTIWVSPSVSMGTYIVPPSFQLDLYVNSLFPSFDLKVNAYPDRIVVSAMHNDHPIETHEGVFSRHYDSH